MKQGWKYMKLGSASTFMSGYTPNKDEIQETGQYPYFKVAEMNKLGNEIFMVNTSLFVNHPKKVFPKGSIIFPKNGGAIYTEKKRILKFDSVVDLNTEALFPNDQVNTFYLFYFLNHLRIAKFDKGGGLPSLDLKRMADDLIPVPPLPEQERIVERLDAAFAQIDELKSNAEKQFAEAHALFQAALTQAMQPKPGWKSYKFNDLIDNLRTGLNPRTHFKLNTSDSVGYYITVRELKGFTFEVDKRTDRINEDAIKRINERSNLKIGDVLYSGTGTIGKTALVQELPTWWNIKEGVYAITPKANTLDSSFLIYVMHSDYFMSEVLSKTSGTTVRSIPMKMLKEIIMSIPSISEQQIIVEHLDALSNHIKNLEEISRKTAAECDALKQALLRQIFE